MKTIVFTGGGTAGHVVPNLAIIPQMQESGWNVEYIGSENGMEKRIIQDFGGIPYHGIPTGKLRRYFDLNNVKDPFKVIKGVFRAYAILKKIKPRVVFSKGGFVAVPVILASFLRRIPVVIHESDYSPGLANKISIPFATKVCVTFAETMEKLPSRKTIHTGPLIRSRIFQGDAAQGRKLCGFHRMKPALLIMGGSLGSQAINRAIRGQLDALLATFEIIHICGKGNVDPQLQSKPGYKQLEYVDRELPDVLAMADLVVSRAGSNAIFEFLALQKPMLLIPLSRKASRGDQILNAQSFEKSGYCRVLYEEHLDGGRLVREVGELYAERRRFAANMSRSAVGRSAEQIAGIVDEIGNA